jgi:hypothetical protein
MRTRIFLISSVVVVLTSLLPACELLEECGTCELVTIQADGSTSRGTPLPFCGDALAEKKNSSPVTVGGVTTYWDCY